MGDTLKPETTGDDTTLKEEQPSTSVVTETTVDPDHHSLAAVGDSDKPEESYWSDSSAEQSDEEAVHGME